MGNRLIDVKVSTFLDADPPLSEIEEFVLQKLLQLAIDRAVDDFKEILATDGVEQKAEQLKDLIKIEDASLEKLCKICPQKENCNREECVQRTKLVRVQDVLMSEEEGKA